MSKLTDKLFEERVKSEKLKKKIEDLGPEELKKWRTAHGKFLKRQMNRFSSFQTKLKMQQNKNKLKRVRESVLQGIEAKAEQEARLAQLKEMEAKFPGMTVTAKAGEGKNVG